MTGVAAALSQPLTTTANEGRVWANPLLAGPWFAAEALLAGGAAVAGR